MKKWLIVHNIVAYNQHNDMIGNIVKTKGAKQPKAAIFSKIAAGDIIIYYASRNSVVVGVFEVVSEMAYLAADPYWKEMMVLKIKPLDMPPEGMYLDFRKLVKDNKTEFDLFTNKICWGSYLMGKTAILLTEKDYLTIRSALRKQTYLKKATN